MSDEFYTEFEVKSEIDEEGRFEGLASVFNKVDLVGDTILPGAYKKTIKNIKATKRVVPFLWRHQQEEVMGGFDELEETPKGLKVKGRIIRDLSDYSEKAYRLMKEKLASGLSIGYRVPQGGATYSEGFRTIKELNLLEISFTPVPVDQYASVTSIKELTELRGKLAAGDRLSVREMERLLKEYGNLTNAQAERAVRVNVKHGSGAPSNSNGFDLKQELKALIAKTEASPHKKD